MSCILSDGTHSVDLQHGPEWGYQSALSLGIRWERMTSGLWRNWDLGYAFDHWSSTWTWRGHESLASSLYALLNEISKGAALTLTSDQGLYPFGPLFDLSAGLAVRMGPVQPGARLPGSSLWSMSLALYLDPVPAVSLENRSLDPILRSMRGSASILTSWDIEPRLSGFRAAGGGPDAFQTTVASRMSTDDFRRALRQVLWMRATSFGLQLDGSLFGPGVPASQATPTAHIARIKSVAWSHLAADLWELSSTLVRDP